MIDRASELRAIADGRLMLNVRNGVTVSRSMLAMIADEIDALRAAPLAPAEVGRLVERFNITAGVMEMGERIAWGSDTTLMREAATALEAQAAELAAVKENCETVCNSYADENQRLYDRAERAEAALAEARKALDALDRMSRGVDWCDQDEQARRWSAARRALTGGHTESRDREVGE